MNKNGINNNMLLTLALMALVWWLAIFVVRPEMKTEQAHQAALAHQEKAHPLTTAPGAPADVPGMALSSTHMAATPREGGRRARGDRQSLAGWLDRAQGRQFDDLRLKKYHETTNPKSPEIVLLAPKSTDFPYYAEFGWVGAADMPSDQSVWQQQGSGALSPGHPVTLTWDNGHGLTSPGSSRSTTNTCSTSPTA